MSTPTITKAQAIINALLYNSDFSREVLPYIKPEYFESKEESATVEELINYSTNYNSIPSAEELHLEVLKRKDLTETDVENFKELYSNHLTRRYKMKTEWIKAQAEKFCKDRALYLAINEAIVRYEDKNGTRDSIPDLIRDALSVSFDNTTGHDYFEDAEEAYELYHAKENLIPFKLDILNKATGGGVPVKTLNIFMGGTNTFKSGFLCDLAAHYLSEGFNVLYITLEMAEWKIRERIDANLMRLKIPEVKSLIRDSFLDRVRKIKEGTVGRLKIKEYPMTSANVNHFRALLKELEMKDNFKPTVIIVDYISICASTRVKDPSNLYSYNKAIAEELRGLAQETETLMWSAIQTNRSGIDASDVSLDNTAESIGVPQSVDLMWGIINTEELEDKGLIIIKQLKTRYNSKSEIRRILLGIDRERMTIYEVTEEAERGMNLNPEAELSDKPTFDSTPSGEKLGSKFKFN